MKYSENRKNQIFEKLSALKLLNQSEYHNNEFLEPLREFADAMLATIHEKEHASHLSIRHLGQYLLDQGNCLGLENDINITYAAKQLDSLSRRIHALESGKIGEARAIRAMFGIDAPNRILKNVEFSIDGEPFEMDFIIINKAGIFAVESKHFSRKMIIDNTGLLTDPCPGKKIIVKKICMQMANQRAAICRVLTEAFPDNDRFAMLSEHVKSILLTTSDYSIVDLRGKETILDCDSVADYFNNTSSSVELSREEINILADTLEKASCPQVYPLGWDYKRVAEAFAISVAKIEYASENNEEFFEEILPENIENKEDEEMYNNKKPTNESMRISEIEDETDVVESRKDKFSQAIYVITKICELINTVGNVMEGAQKIYTAKDNITTARNNAKTQKIQSQINMDKKLHHQRRVEAKLNKTR